MDTQFLNRIAESSPVVVLILLVAGTVLWRKLDAKDKMLLDLQRETLVALAGATQAVHDLKDALLNKR